MKDLRADLSAWLSLDLSKTMDAAKEISNAQTMCASSQTNTGDCLRRAEHALQSLDSARESLAKTIWRTEHHVNSDS